ncbi:MAG: alkaline shock response membrane anchor protein AmaP [Eubacteriales bacterium]|nr:alkaline shock response membrane anchor protein AmaP [Eubacteriales bacterium]
MKTHMFNKVVMFVVALFFGALGIYLACISTGILPYQPVVDALAWVNTGWLQMLCGGVVGLVLFAVGIKILAIVFARDTQHGRYATVAKNTLGDVIITTDTIKQVVQRSITAHPQIQSSLVFITTRPESVDICVKMALKLDGLNVPEVTADIQQTIRAAVADTTGIAVSAVRINVDNTVVGHG